MPAPLAPEPVAPEPPLPSRCSRGRRASSRGGRTRSRPGRARGASAPATGTPDSGRPVAPPPRPPLIAPRSLIGAAFAGGFAVALILKRLARWNGQPENLATAVTEVSERMSLLVREEIELAKARSRKRSRASRAGPAVRDRGCVRRARARVVLLTLALGLKYRPLGSIWLGFLIVFGVLLVVTVLAFLFAWRKIKVGAPTPKIAIEEAKKIRETVSPSTRESADGDSHPGGDQSLDRAEPAGAGTSLGKLR